MTPRDVLRLLTEQGVMLVADGERLRFRRHEALTDDLRELIVENKADLLRLLSVEESEVAWRVEAMRGQYRPGVGFFFLAARREFVDAPGCCLSCGDPLRGGKHRCPPCARAAEIVVNEVMEGRTRRGAPNGMETDRGH